MNCWRPHLPPRLRPTPAREPSTATSASSFWRSRWSVSPMRASTVSASANYSARWACRTPRSIRRQPGVLRFRPRPMTAAFRKRIIQGEVQDENASVLGGVAGHAGVFATAEDLAIFSTPAARRPPAGSPGNPGALHSPGNRACRHFPGIGLGHTFLALAVGKIFLRPFLWASGLYRNLAWIDPERQLSITLLTNRTWPDCSNKPSRQCGPCFTMP